jgi:flagellar hook-associated protein 1 FlgK
MSLDLAFGIARTGLQATQRALAQVSQNIANAETPGYTRKDLAPIALQAADRPMGLRLGEARRLVDDALVAERRLDAAPRPRRPGCAKPCSARSRRPMEDPRMATAWATSWPGCAPPSSGCGPRRARRACSATCCARLRRRQPLQRGGRRHRQGEGAGAARHRRGAGAGEPGPARHRRPVHAHPRRPAPPACPPPTWRTSGIPRCPSCRGACRSRRCGRPMAASC